jgi:hypothetical protein
VCVCGNKNELELITEIECINKCGKFSQRITLNLSFFLSRVRYKETHQKYIQSDEIRRRMRGENSGMIET